MISGIDATGVTLAAGSASNPEALFTGVEPGTAMPATIAIGTNLSGSAKVSIADLTFPIGSLMDSAGALNTSSITLPAAGAQLDSLTAAAGLSGTGPYSVKTAIPSVTSNLVVGTLTKPVTYNTAVAIPATLAMGATLTGATKVTGANLVFPV
ncbi:MAG: hypothetical protein R8J84_06890 [Mariprofundales bacterium]